MRLTIESEGQEGRTVELPDEVVKALRAIAERHDITLEQAIAQAVVNQEFLEDQVGSDGELVVKKGDTLRHLQYA